MRLTRHILIALTLLFISFMHNAHLAFAQDTRSEFFYQAHEGETFVEGRLRYSNISHDNATGVVTPDLDFKITSLNFYYEYGLLEFLSLYSGLGYSKETVSEFFDFAGLTPLSLGAKYRLPMQSGSFFVKANVNLGLWEKLECKPDGGSSTTVSCGLVDQSASLSLLLGYMFQFEDAYLGFAAQSGVVTTKGKSKNPAADITKDPTMSLTVFYERILKHHIWGGSMQYLRASVGGADGHSIFSSNSFFSEETDDVQFMKVKTYTRISILENLELLGELHYDYILNQGSAQFDGGYGFGAQLGARYSF